MKKIYFYHKSCNFCNSSKKKKLYSLGQQNLVRCLNCKLVYFDKQRTDFDELYNTDYYSVGEGNATANYADYLMQEKTIKKNFLFAYLFISKKIKQRKKFLLEIGPGFGYFIKNLPKSVICDGVEVSKEAVSYMRKKKIQVKQGDFLVTKLKRKYNVVAAFDVIEHQIFLKEFLQKVRDLLKDDGVFILTTPDFNSIPNKIWGKRAPTIQPLYHNYYFDKQWFIEQMPKMGFKIVSIKTVYVTHLSVGQIILLASFALPIIKNLHVAKIAKILKLNNIVLKFFRFGGIECIIQKAA